MYQTENTIGSTPFDGLTVQKLASKEGCETLLITLEKGHHFPEHSSPRDVLLVMLEGDINFSINKTIYPLLAGQTFTFPANEKHEVSSKENSKFLIIR